MKSQFPFFAKIISEPDEQVYILPIPASAYILPRFRNFLESSSVVLIIDDAVCICDSCKRDFITERDFYEIVTTVGRGWVWKAQIKIE